MTPRFRAPGRVNLMGDHTDYNDGFVLPAAIQLECTAEGRPSADGRIRASSAGRERELDIAADGSDDAATVRPYWGRYVAGVVRALADRGRPSVGAELTIESTVPAGSGLSSSAALEVATALALCDAAGFELPPRDLALACQEAERLATGVPSGIMDQLTSLAGEAEHALLLDCRDLTWRAVPVPATIGLVVVHSGIQRTLESSEYAERRAACEAIAARLGLRALRDATLDQVAGEPVARHVVTENARVHETARALEAADLSQLGRLFSESHESLRSDYRVSTPELDTLVELLVEAGAAGARLTGAGFGGCVVAVCAGERARAIGEEAAARYAEQTALEPWSLVARPSAGAGPA